MDEPLDISVVIATVGRPRQLAACLDSIASGDRRPVEVVVVDQSGGDEVAATVARFGGIGARVVPSSERGVGLARNLGLRHAAHDIVLMTDDDCTVDRSWTATAHAMMEPGAPVIISGRVLPHGDRRNVPSIKEETSPHDYTGTLRYWGLSTNNVVMSRSAVLEFGAFDESFETGEDNDLCYRWLKAGRQLRYEPRLTVWHHDWRTPEEMRRLYVAYWRGHGHFFGKHIRRGDMWVLRRLVHDTRGALRDARRRDGSSRAQAARGIFRGLPPGLATGLVRRSRHAASSGERTG